jgi:hypothetical protein
VLIAHRSRSIQQLRDFASAEAFHSDAMFAATGGIPAGTDHLRDLAHTVREAASGHGYPHDVGEAARVASDKTIARALHRTMQIVPAEAAAHDVWTFATIQLLPDVVAWRFPSSTDDERWICKDMTRHTLGRLWWQAHALAMPVGSAWDYHLIDILMESEINQVFERRSIGGRPALARAVVRAMSTRDTLPVTVARRDLMRDATRRLRRLIPFTAFLALDDTALQNRIDAVFRESAEALTAAKLAERGAAL